MMGRYKVPPKHPKELESFENYLKVRPQTCVNTRKVYLWVVDNLLTIVDKQEENITVGDIERWQLWSKEHYKQKSLSLMYAGATIYIRYLVNRRENKHLLSKDGTPIRLKTKQVKSPRAEPLTKEEIKQLFEASRYNIRDNAILKTLYYAVPRKSELINMNVEHVNFRKNSIKILDIKNKEYVEIFVSPECTDSIKKYVEIRKPKNPEESALFLNPYGWRIGRADIRNTVKRYAVKCGITKRVYPHLFRHTGITHLAEAGFNSFQIRSLSRHKSLDILIDYVNLAEQDKERVANALSQGLEDNEPEKPPQPPIKREQAKDKKEPPKEDVAYNTPLDISVKDEYLQLLRDELITPQQYRELISGKINSSMYQ